MSTGNAKRQRHLEVAARDFTRTGPAQKMTTASTTSSYLVRSHTKRNLFNQYNDDTIAAFAKPTGKMIQSKRANVTSNTKGVSNLIVILKNSSENLKTLFFKNLISIAFQIYKPYHRHCLIFRRIKS